MLHDPGTSTKVGPRPDSLSSIAPSADEIILETVFVLPLVCGRLKTLTRKSLSGFGFDFLPEHAI